MTLSKIPGEIEVTIDIARKILRNNKSESAIGLISENHDCFIWDEDGDELEQWSRIAEQRGLPAVTSEFLNGDSVYYSYKGNSLFVPLLSKPRDSTIGVHVLGSLVYSDLELRVVVDTIGNSEFAFLPLTPKEWDELGSEFGVDTIELRFVSLGDSVEDMLDRAERAYDLCFSEEPDTSNDPSVGPYMALLKSLPSNWLHVAEWINLQNSDGSIRIDDMSSLLAGFSAASVNVYFESTVAGREKKGAGFTMHRDDVLNCVIGKIKTGGEVSYVFNDAYSHVVAFYSNFTACVWGGPVFVKEPKSRPIISMLNRLRNILLPG